MSCNIVARLLVPVYFNTLGVSIYIHVYLHVHTHTFKQNIQELIPFITHRIHFFEIIFITIIRLRRKYQTNDDDKSYSHVI